MCAYTNDWKQPIGCLRLMNWNLEHRVEKSIIMNKTMPILNHVELLETIKIIFRNDLINK